MAFKIAASLALKEAKNKCKPVLLEPIMKVDIVVPEEYFGNVMGDITSRRGKPLSQESRGNDFNFQQWFHYQKCLVMQQA